MVLLDAQPAEMRAPTEQETNLSDGLQRARVGTLATTETRELNHESIDSACVGENETAIFVWEFREWSVGDMGRKFSCFRAEITNPLSDSKQMEHVRKYSK